MPFLVLFARDFAHLADIRIWWVPRKALPLRATRRQHGGRPSQILQWFEPKFLGKLAAAGYIGQKAPSAAALFSYNAGLSDPLSLYTFISCIQGQIMPKQKTHKGTKKRFRLTASGKAKHRSAGTSHLAARMSQKRKRNLRGTTTTAASSTKTIVKALAGNSY